jgi:hypothetical protein
MNRSGPRSLARCALVVLAALLLIGGVESAAPPAPLVAAGADELDKFAPVDMAEAVKRATIAN